MTGSTIAHYQVGDKLGAGGMGEVYRARDSRLGRDVAIKILPPTFASDPERLARVQREAQVLAALNHPNIAAIYGIEQNALVMELVEGEDLNGPLPLATAVNYARQIADALEAAHERGIVHRDLKPANIKITHAGVVKLLDFGLAKAVDEPAAGASSLTMSPTLSLAMTQAGVILGTAAYMSPEQARGKPVDKRADIWSFGLVFYEMLTGHQPYSGGETVSDAMAAVITKDPDWSKLPADTPAHIRRLLERCLRKDPKLRLRDIGEARVLLDEAPAEVQAATARDSAISSPTSAVVLSAILAVALIATSIVAWRATRPAPLRPLIRLSAEVGTDATLERVRSSGMLALSPDGTRLAVTFRGKDGKALLGTRLLHQGALTPLANTEGAATPFFSPDGQWIGFSSEGKLKKISVEGGAAITICSDVPNLRGASWGDDGNIVFAPDASDGLSRVSSDGGTPSSLSKLKEGERSHRWPQVLPGSKAVLFTVGAAAGTYDSANIEVQLLQTGERKILHRGGFSGQYLPSGHLIYVHQSTLFATSFDVDRLALTGTPVPILEDAGSNTVAGGDFAFSKTGSFVYLSGNATNTGWGISWLDSTGKRQVLNASLGRYLTPRISPDGRRLAYAFAASSAQDNIWVKDLERNTPSRLTFLGGTNTYPVWTPDSRNIVFESTDPASPGMYWIPWDGSGAPHRLTEGKARELPSSISPDGKRLAFLRITSGQPDIWTAPIEGDNSQPRLGKAELFLGTPFADADPAFSPDGRWMAYSSSESGALEVFVRPFPGPGGRWQISTGGGRFPRWARSGRELVFERLDGSGVMAVSYTTSRSAQGDTFTASTPKVWSAVRLITTGNLPNYDLAPDGKRIASFLLAEDAEGQKPLTHLVFLLNFFDELRRKTK